MTNISNMLVNSNAGNTALVTHNINENTTVDLTNYTTMMVIRSTGEYTITINDPTKEMQDVLVKNDSIYTITLVMGSTGSVEMTAGLTIKIIPTGTEGDYTWYAVSANEIDFDTIIPIGSVEYKILPEDIEPGNFFGDTVSMSGDGTRCIVGSKQNDEAGNLAGAAYIFQWDGVSWVEEHKLMAFDPHDIDYFGWSVSINDDGTKCAVGSYGDDDVIVGSGSVYIYKFNGVSWDLEQKFGANDPKAYGSFGSDVSISGDGTKCAVGSINSDVTTAFGCGAVYIFSFDGSAWTQNQKLETDDASSGDKVGDFVSLNTDGSRCITSAAGESSTGSSTGAAYVFSRVGTVWTQDQKLFDDTTSWYTHFGNKVSVSGDGLKVMVGAHQQSSVGGGTGVAYIFDFNGVSWVQNQKLVGSDSVVGDYFGWSVSINDDGTKCIVGAINDDNVGENSGASYIFDFNGVSWVQNQKLVVSDLNSNDENGYSVSMAGDGSRVIVSSLRESTGGVNAGAAYIY